MHTLILAALVALSPGADWKKTPMTALSPSEAVQVKSSPWTSPEKPSRVRLAWDSASEAAKGINPDLMRELRGYAADLAKGEGTRARVTVKVLEFEEKSSLIYGANKTRGRVVAEITIRTEDGKLLYASQEEVLVKGSDMASSLTDTVAKVAARKLFSAIENAL